MISDEELVAFVFAFVVYYNSQRFRHSLTRSALIPPNYSPWKRLLGYGDNQSFLNVTGFTRFAFDSLSVAVNGDLPYNFSNVGRPKLLSPEDELGLTLLFLNSRAELKYLSLIFGVIPSTVSKTIGKTIKKIILGLRTNEMAAIQFPNANKMQQLAALVEAREPRVDNIIGFVDRLSIPVQCSSTGALQFTTGSDRVRNRA
jgi:hypothetical protein